MIRGENVVHYFYIINDFQISKIIEKMGDKHLSFREKIILNNFIFKNSSQGLKISDDIFRRLNHVEFRSFFYNSEFENKGFNYYGITIIPFSSLNKVKDSFLNLTKEEYTRLEDIYISKQEYEVIVKDLIDLFNKAIQNKLPIIHYGI